MKLSEIKKLAQASYKKNELNEEIVLKIAKNLTRSELRQYIKELKLIEAKNTVKVFVSSKSRALEVELRKIFNSKKVEFTEDKNLIAGIKIVDFDKIYEVNLKNTLDSMVEYINK